MKLVPPPPPVREGKLAVSQGGVVAALRHGILDGCVMDGGPSSTYWPHDGRYHPLHAQCVYRLFEHWEALLADAADDDAPAVAVARSTGLRGAYARRAVKAGNVRQGDSAALAAFIPEEVRANPHWLPGMGSDAPWVVVVETNVGRQCHIAKTREDGQKLLHYWRRAIRLHELAYGALLLDPRQAEVEAWGEVPDISAAPRWERIVQAQEWVRCRRCPAWRWPGSWVSESGTCPDCTVDAEPRVWPDELPFPGGLIEPPRPPKTRGKQKATSFD